MLQVYAFFVLHLLTERQKQGKMGGKGASPNLEISDAGSFKLALHYCTIIVECVRNGTRIRNHAGVSGARGKI